MSTTTSLSILGLTLAIGIPAIAGAHAVHQQTVVHAAADATALAAADALTGWADGDPCAHARDIASRHGVHLEACDLDPQRGAARTLTSAGTAFGPVSGRAHAGPPLE